MNEEQIRVLRELCGTGYAVIVWTPEELRGANPRKVEDRTVELSHGVIESLVTEGQP